MALAEKNSDAFVKANARRAEKLQALDALVGEVADLTTRKRQLENELASLDVEIVDAVAKKQTQARTERASRAVTQAQVGGGETQAQQGDGGGDGGDLSQTTEKPDLSYHRSADGLFTTFLPNTPEGENAWRTMNATQNSDGGKVLASHTEAVIQQIRDAGYTVSEDASAPVTADEVDAMVADLTGAGQGDGPTAAQQEPAVNASAWDVQQPANSQAPEPVAALPNLVGNEKQVAWAEDIRNQVAINVARALKISENDITDHGDDLPDAFFQEVHELHKAQADKLMSNADAQFWIDSRVFALGAQLADSHPSSSDTPLTMLSNWDRADRAKIKALREKYRAAQQEPAAPPDPVAPSQHPAS
jgi:hypothetical protein